MTPTPPPMTDPKAETTQVEIGDRVYEKRGDTWLEWTIGYTQWLVIPQPVGVLLDEIATHRSDLASAAGECLVPVPEPGTDTAKLLHANVMWRYQRDELQRELAALRARLERRDRAIRWACGYDDFTPTFMERGPFWWRSRLVSLAGVTHDELTALAPEVSNG